MTAADQGSTALRTLRRRFPHGAKAKNMSREPGGDCSASREDTADVLSDLCARSDKVLRDAPMPFLDRDRKFDSSQMRIEASVRTGTERKVAVLWTVEDEFAGRGSLLRVAIRSRGRQDNAVAASGSPRVRRRE